MALWVGALHIPRPLLLFIFSATRKCDTAECKRRRRDLTTIKYFAPRWFLGIEANILFECLPIHFYIQTPRVVPSLCLIDNEGLDGIRRMLDARRITLSDVEPDGRTILHVSGSFSGDLQIVADGTLYSSWCGIQLGVLTKMDRLRASDTCWTWGLHRSGNGEACKLLSAEAWLYWS